MAKSYNDLVAENEMLRRELRVAREAAEITSDLVVKQFEQTEKMLRRFQEANAQRQAVLDAASRMSIIATDLEGNIQLFNRGATNLLGYSSQEMVGQANILSLHLEEELSMYAQHLQKDLGTQPSGMDIFDQCVKKQLTEAREWTYKCKDGTLLPTSLSITPLHDADGRMSGYLFTAMDLTDRKQLEQDLIRAKEEAEHANASKGDFLARMIHEIRTPMNAVTGMASLLQRTELDPKQQDYVQKIMSSSNTLLHLINDILDFSKIDAGKLEIEEVPFDLEEVLDNVSNVVGLRAEEKGLEFLFHMDPGVPRYLIGDPLRLGQVLMNLCSNAIKFTHEGEILVRVKLEEMYGDRAVLFFSVRDTGIGLSREQAQDLFQAFHQADDSFTRRFGGTGLGLAICKQLTEMMGGEIGFESKPEQGSNFYFTAKFSLQEHQGETQAYIPDTLHNRRVLVVDDNPNARTALSSMLASWNMEVEIAADGNQALNILNNAAWNGSQFDIILLDWMMPGMNGIEAARRIKEHPHLTQTPALLMVTAHAREEVRAQAEQVGLDLFLPKPVYPSVLYNSLLQVLGVETSTETKRQKKEIHTRENLEAIQGARILLVEDNPLNQEVTREFLEDAGMEVEIAENGIQALEKLKNNSYHLVFMDIQMPEMDGLEATRRIRAAERGSDLSDLSDFSDGTMGREGEKARERLSDGATERSESQNSRIPESLNSKIPIVAMTAHALKTDQDKSLEAGMNDHINKPVQPQSLYRVLLDWIPPQETREETGALETARQGARSAPEKTSDLPSLPGIDIQEALQRVHYKEKLLYKMTREFLKNYHFTPAWCQEQAAAGEWEEVRIKSHALKGASGYLGALTLQRAAAELESALKQGERGEHVWTLLENFIQALKEGLNSLSELSSILASRNQPQQEGPLSSSVQHQNLEAVEPRLKQLQQKLQQGEYVSQEFLSEINNQLVEPGLRKHWEHLVELIDDIELQAASRATEELLTQVREAIQGESS